MPLSKRDVRKHIVATTKRYKNVVEKRVALFETGSYEDDIIETPGLDAFEQADPVAPDVVPPAIPPPDIGVLNG